MPLGYPTMGIGKIFNTQNYFQNNSSFQLKKRKKQKILQTLHNTLRWRATFGLASPDISSFFHFRIGFIVFG